MFSGDKVAPKTYFLPFFGNCYGRDLEDLSSPLSTRAHELQIAEQFTKYHIHGHTKRRKPQNIARPPF